MLDIDVRVAAAIDACIMSGSNQTFFASLNADVGEVLQPAYDLFALTENRIDGQNALKLHPFFAKQQRLTKNMSLLAVKLTLQPDADDKAANSLCSDYARVLAHTFARGFTVDQFVEIFTTGKFKETLRAAREADPKRKDAGMSTTARGLGEPIIQVVLRRSNSAATILRSAPLGNRDPTDPSQLEDLVLELMASVNTDAIKRGA